MSYSPLILAYDLGTSAVKVGLFDNSGNLVASALQGYDTLYPVPNGAEQQAEDWWSAICKASRLLLQQNPEWRQRIICISFSGQMMGCLPVDKQGKPLRPSLIWADQRAIKEAELLARCIGDSILYERTGQKASPAFSLAKILWLKHNEPQVYRKTYKILNAKDFIVARLTGKFHTDPSDASGSNIYSLKEGKWDTDILSAVDIDINILPEIVPSTAVVGSVTQQAATNTGLVAGIPVVMGGGDGDVSAIGAGIVKPGDAFISLGSSAWFAIVGKSPIDDPEMRLTTEAHVIPGLYLPNGTTFNGGGPYKWLKDNIFDLSKESKGENPYEIMEQLAATIHPGSNGLLFLPYLMGEKCPYADPKIRGAFLGLDCKHQRPDLVRAVLEGCTMNLRLIYELFQNQGIDISTIRLVGGGASSPLWSQIIADVFNIPIEIPRYQREVASLGAAITGAVGVGLYKDFSIAEELIEIESYKQPITQHTLIYEKMYRIFVNSYSALESLNKQLFSEKS